MVAICVSIADGIGPGDIFGQYREWNQQALPCFTQFGTGTVGGKRIDEYDRAATVHENTRHSQPREQSVLTFVKE